MNGGRGSGPAILAAACLLLAGFDPFKREAPSIKEGNKLYSEQKYDNAIEKYGEEFPKEGAMPEVHFDRGDANYKLNKRDDARREYLWSLERSEGKLRAAGYYNLGNTFLGANGIEDAIRAYKQSLAIDPQNQDAKFNLELALKLKREQQQQQKKQQQTQMENLLDSMRDNEEPLKPPQLQVKKFNPKEIDKDW